ncbi:unnamed protein product [Toxocara canis]|uniref:YlaH-like protein n=1 Tax=Toxocara canis TaxID=6265 RepID=A0A183U5K5_TOXCA|nr:unnamed protein product [Toxocara canis]
MMQKLRDALIFYIALGVYLLITIFLAALDVRMVQIVNNLVALVVALILGVVYCWQVGLLGVALMVIVLIAIVVLAKFMDKYNDIAIKEDLSGQVNTHVP